MKTTLNLDDELLKRAKRRAADRRTTLTAVVEDALRDALSDPVRPTTPFRLQMPTVRGEGAPAVDPADRVALYDILDRRSTKSR